MSPKARRIVVFTGAGVSAEWGSRNVIHVRGELLTSHCENCGAVIDTRGDTGVGDRCALCNGRIRPHIAWLGEVPLRMNETLSER